MGCPPVRGDNPRALASGLSYVQVDKRGITILYHQHQCRRYFMLNMVKVYKYTMRSQSMRYLIQERIFAMSPTPIDWPHSRIYFHLSSRKKGHLQKKQC